MNLNKTIVTIVILLNVVLQGIALAEWPSRQKAIEAGSHTFYRFCSICHGFNAEGNGPYTESLNTIPPDLTTLSANNNDTFPWLRLYQIIDGTDVSKAHGSSEMPIWGNQFDLNNWANRYNEFADVIVRGRIFELLVYLESIQTKQEN